MTQTTLASKHTVMFTNVFRVRTSHASITLQNLAPKRKLRPQSSFRDARLAVVPLQKPFASAALLFVQGWCCERFTVFADMSNQNRPSEEKNAFNPKIFIWQPLVKISIKHVGLCDSHSS